MEVRKWVKKGRRRIVDGATVDNISIFFGRIVRKSMKKEKKEKCQWRKSR